MKLPICYILDHIRAYVGSTGFEDAAAGYLVKRPVFYEGEKVLKGERLYLSQQEILSDSRQETGAFCIGKTAGFHGFSLKEGASIYELSNRIHRLFDEAEDWYDRMKQCGEKNGSLADILELAGQYLPYYTAVMAPDFLIVERLRRDLDSNADIHEETGYLNMEIVNCLKQDECYDAVETYEKPFLYAGKGLSDRFLCANFLENGIFRGRINIREKKGEGFREWDAFFLECVRDAALPVFLKEGCVQEKKERWRMFVQRLLEGKENAREGLLFFLEEKNWLLSGCYQCICLESQPPGRQEEILYYARELEYLVEGSVCVPLENRIFLLRSVPKENGAEQAVLEKLSYFIRESDFRMGMSRIYTDLTKTCYAKNQARIALDFGMKQLSWQWKYRFEEVVLSYLSSCCLQELPAEYAGSPAFALLRERDDKSGSDLFETLICFVKSDFHIVETARRLFVHRGTLIYRLNRIRELTGVRWDNWKEKLYLSWSVQMLEWAKGGG